MSVGFRIYLRVERPKSETVSKITLAAVANIADAMHGMGVMDSGIRPIYSAMRRIGGIAITVDLTPGDGLMLRKAIEIAEEGDVVVANAHGCIERATLGGNVCISADHKRLAGIIVDGAARDADEAREINFPVMARALSPRSGTTGAGWGEVNIPIACGGVVVYPGDIIVGDHEGIVVVPGNYADEVLELLGDVEEKKGRPEDLTSRVKAARDAPIPSIESVNKAMEERRARVIDGPFKR